MRRTLEHAAAHSSFYADRFRDSGTDIVSIHDAETFSRVPLLDKKTATAHQAAMRCGDDPTDYGSLSSGTTRVGAELFRVEHCPAEFDALAAHMAAAPTGTLTGVSDRVLEIVTPNHGLPATLPEQNTIRLAWTYLPHLHDMALDALRNDAAGRRITVVRASISVVQQLTTRLVESGDDFSDFAVTHFGTNAGLVTSRWRDIVAQTWGAVIVDNYSLSEFRTPATQCAHCDAFHFGEPPLYWETVHPRTHKPVNVGVGELVLTGLFPFVQRQPLIRYRTGDLVERTPYCDRVDDQGFRFVGRTHQTPLDDDGMPLLWPSRCENIIDAQAWVSRHTHPAEQTATVAVGRVGAPRWRVVQDGRTLRVEVGVDFSPALFDTDDGPLGALCAALRAMLLDAHPSLLQTGSDAYRLEVVPVAARRDDYAQWFVKFLM